MELAGIGLALLAGVLTSLSPCVLPLLPIVIATALGEHRFGPAALAAGLALSFVIVGLFVATVGFAAGLDQELFRSVAAVLLILVGGVLLVPRLQLQLAAAAGPIANWTQAHTSGMATRGLGGQFAVGLMLGAVWSPCVGPTLGAASVLAARAENLVLVALTMLAFGIGAALPLLAIGMMSREALTRWRGRLLAAGSGGKLLMGAVLVATGALILTGLDKRLEAVLVEASPAWLTELTTRF
jgi:cytochrome c-type biogenesis protein